jgi:hypothetical protein
VDGLTHGDNGENVMLALDLKVDQHGPLGRLSPADGLPDLGLILDADAGML